MQNKPVALILVVALLALAVLAGILGWLGWQFTQLDPPIAAALRVTIFAVPLGLLGAAGVVGLHIAWRRWASLELLKADRVVKLTAAQQQRFPSGLTTLSFHDSSRPLPVPHAAQAEPLALPAPSDVPTFGQLLDAGKVGAGRPLLFGYSAATHQPIEGTWSKLYSVGIGGQPGSGKTWCAAFLLAQSAAAGAKLIIIDPHAGDDESLSNRLAGLSASLYCAVASDTKAIESALKLASGELERRKAGHSPQEQIIVVADEWTSLLRGKLGELLTATALDISEQGRKYGMFAMLIAQGWQVEAAGAVRDRLTSHFVLRTRGDQLRWQTGLRGSAPLDTLFLKDAEAYFLSNAGDMEKIVIPRMTSADLANISGTVKRPFGYAAATRPATLNLPAATPIVAEHRPKSNQNVTAAVSATTAPQSATAASPEATRAAALFVAGSSPADIVRELRGIGSKEGSRYQTALNEVLDLVRQGLRGI